MNELLLGEVPLFASLPPSELHQLATTLHHYEFAPDTILFREGEVGNQFYLLLEGQVEILKAFATADERLLGVRGPGEFVGDMSLLLGDGLRTATVRTRTAVQGVTLTRTAWEALLARHPALASELVRVMSQRLREADNATIQDLQLKHRQLTQAYQELQAAQTQLIEHEQLERERQVAQERLDQELRLAQLVQQTLLRKPVPALPGWVVTTYYQPARAVGGDFYDVLTLPSGHLGLVMGDVSGKGMPAALLMATTRSILRGVAQAVAAPGAVLAQVNDLLCPDMPPSMFVTCLYALLDPVSGQLQYANAGHDLPYRQHNGGVDELRATGVPLGLWPGNRYEEQGSRLLPGERILFSSDGLVEAHNPQREMFGSPRLRALLADHATASGAALLAGLLAALAQFTGAGWEQEDDLMLVTLERSATGVEPSSPAEGERYA